MRIAFVTFEFGEHTYGGAGTYANEIVPEIANLGHEVVVFAPERREAENEGTVHTADRVVRISIPVSSRFPALQFWLRLPAAFRLANAIARFDVIHFNGLCYWFARKRLSESPHILTVHHLVKDTIASASPGPLGRICNLSGETGLLVPLLESRVVTCVDRFIAVSSHTKSRLIKAYSVMQECIDVVHHGADTDAYVFKEEELEKCRQALGLSNRPRLVFVGRIDDPRKNLDLLIAALPSILKEVEAELVVVGAGDTGKISRLTRALSLASSVRILGHVSETTLHKVFALADVVVIPSRLEGFGLTAVEGMAAGKPIVATRVGALPEIVKDGVNGFIVPEDMPEVLADKIVTILSNQHMASDMSQQNIATAENWFTWKKAAIETIGVYQKALADFDGV